MSKNVEVLPSVGVIGLGNLGLPVARRLQTCGFRVVGYDARSSVRGSALDLDVVESVQEVVESSDAVLILVGSAGQCADVIAHIVATPPSGSSPKAGVARLRTVVLMSTVGPDAVARLADPLLNRGIEMLDVPVSGGADAAREGQLALMAGGPTASMERVLPWLALLGTVTPVGPLGAGQLVKLANQIVFFGTQAVLQEALDLASTASIEREALMEVLSGGTADCWSVRNPDFLLETARAYEKADVAPQLRPWHKDLAQARQVAQDRSVDVPVVQAVTEVFGDRLDARARA
ncbi:NAD(P)-dependent oxidoreductase (plasmid) [Glutamicibacter sp. FR1]|uniref:NAD(P)-dependent oxidoreductase n=1 Tax=unclassified Glutamicibacter TaxID=2627139 RepID=UPI00143D6E80|nr:NAD(P)-dependent oxidoreductase [Glutamicibacter sp. ZJUTW]